MATNSAEKEIKLYVPSPGEWLQAVTNNFDAFLRDHADCERKASAMAMSFVAKYPDRTEIIPELIATAVEELVHFQQVYKIMERRNIQLTHELSQDYYVKQLIDLCCSGREERFLDRLVVASVVECRGAERFRLVCESLQDEELKTFYYKLWKSEEKHGYIFVDMARYYFEEANIQERLNYFLLKEGEILNNLEIRAALH